MFDELAASLQSGANRVELEIEGEDKLPWSLDFEYASARPADDPQAPLRLSTRLASSSVEEGESVNLEIALENTSEEGLPMSLAIIGIPAGLAAPTEVLDDLKEAEAFDLWEIRGSELVLYWRDLAPRAREVVRIDLIARIPGTTTGPASRAYLYYSPDGRRWSEGLTIEVTAVEKR